MAKIQTRREVLTIIKDKCPDFEFDMEKCFSDISYANGVLEEFNKFWLPKLVKSVKTVAKATAKRYYGVTLTTNADKPKTLNEFKDVLQQISKISGVIQIHAAVELTEAGTPHIHAIVSTSKYLEAKLVLRANGREFVKVDILKKDADRRRFALYMDKAAEDTRLDEFLRSEGSKRNWVVDGKNC